MQTGFFTKSTFTFLAYQFSKIRIAVRLESYSKLSLLNKQTFGEYFIPDI
jgi:hypothetical protein